jgi:hypothetical protein
MAALEGVDRLVWVDSASLTNDGDRHFTVSSGPPVGVGQRQLMT